MTVILLLGTGCIKLILKPFVIFIVIYFSCMSFDFFICILSIFFRIFFLHFSIVQVAVLFSYSMACGKVFNEAARYFSFSYHFLSRNSSKLAKFRVYEKFLNVVLDKSGMITPLTFVLS